MNKNKYMNKNKWFIFEDAPDANPTLTYSYMNSSYVERWLKQIGIKHTPRKYLTIYEGFRYKLCFDQELYNKCVDEVLTKIISTPSWARSLNKELLHHADEFFIFAKSVLRLNLSTLSNRQLARLLEQFYDKQTKMHTLGWLGNVADFGHNRFSNYLLDYLQKQAVRYKLFINPKLAFSALTTPLRGGFAQAEYEGYLNLLTVLRENKKLLRLFKDKNLTVIENELNKYSFGRKFNKLLDKQVKKFGWLGYGVNGPGWDKKHYLELLINSVRENIKPDREFKQAELIKQEVVDKQKYYIKKFAIDRHYQQLFKVAQEFVFTKGYRKDVIFHGFYCLEPLLRELGRRTNLALRQTRYIYPWEYEQVLKEKEKWTDKLNSRFNFHYWLSQGSKQKIRGGEKARKEIKNFTFVRSKQKRTSKLEGDCASPGKVRGVVAIINNPEENKKIEQADILVSLMTNPNLMPAIRKAKAIVTDYGGLTCHAAIVAREFGIPCIVGTKIATQVLKDGDLVEVDATHGIVNILKSNQ